MPTEDEIDAAVEAYVKWQMEPPEYFAQRMLEAAKKARDASFEREIARMNHKEPS